MSQHRDTRGLLGQELKAALVTTPLARVTVAQLCRQAGITRQAFYYHFADLQSLAIWLFQTEVADHIMAHASIDEWADGFERLLSYMRAHREQTYAVVGSLDLAELETFFYHQFHKMMEAIVAEVGKDIEIRTVDRDFVIDHFALSVLGHFLHWLAADMQADPVRLTADLQFIMEGDVTRALQKMATPTPGG